MAEMAGVHDMRLSDHRVDFEVDSDRLAEVVSTLATLGVRSLVSHPPTLEELFMRHYQDGEIGQ
jgi:ABC-2 type transport system ATP-binding protein